MELRKTLPFLLFCLLFSVLTLEGLCQAETVIIRLKFRVVSEVLPMVENQLSQEGKVTADVRTNALVITDNDESIQKIRAFLENYDKEVQQVRIRVKFEEVRSIDGRSISAEGGVSDKHWRVTTGGRGQDGVNVRLRDGSRHREKTSEYFINTMSGSAAYIMTGKDVLYRERWIYLCRRYAGYVDTVSLRRIETGMEVTPIVVGNRVNLEIMPRISHDSPEGGRGVTRFTRASTRISVPFGKWVTIGGADQRSNEVITEILKSGSGKKNSSLQISLMVEKL